MKTVLIVDDEYAIVEALEVLLADAGYKTLCAHDGQEALRVLGDHHVDAIVLDVMMPVMDGLQFIAHKATLPEIADRPVVLVSATPEMVVRSQLHHSDSVVAFLRKPFSADAILAAIEKATHAR